MNRALFLIVVGLGGAAILVWLGVWQVQRLAWKEGIIADINARIVAEPVALPAAPDPARDAYLPVEVTGQMAPDYLRVLVSQKDAGAGYRIISPFVMEDRRVLLDRGFVPVDVQDIPTPGETVSATGNLQWPQETDGFTPAPDLDQNIWFARDVPAMAEALGTDPILIVLRAPLAEDVVVTPLPVDTSRIPNDHLQYAITWFSLATIWLIMSVLFLRRRRGGPTAET
jgi:surfeit locus 1 family protein